MLIKKFQYTFSLLDKNLLRQIPIQAGIKTCIFSSPFFEVDDHSCKDVMKQSRVNKNSSYLCGLITTAAMDVVKQSEQFFPCKQEIIP